MLFGVVGVSHQTATLEQREAAIATIPKFPGSVGLVTCNRVELYVSGEGAEAAHAWRGLLGSAGYAYWGTACMRHLASLTAGLKSALLGETEIQGQVKRAYLEASATELAPALHYLFQKSLQLGKKVRAQNPLYQNTPCYGQALLGQMKGFLGETCRVLMVGSSQVNRRIVEALGNQHAITWCVRQSGAFDAPGHVTLRGFDALQNWQDYDLIVTATRCPHILIEGPAVAGPTPKLLIDLSVPRNIDPSIGQIAHWKLIGLDQLHGQMTQGISGQHLWAHLEEEVAAKADRFMERLQNGVALKSLPATR